MITITRQPTIQPDSIPNTVSRLRVNFNKGITRPIAYRQQQLAGLGRFLEECESKIKVALHDDIGKPPAETLAAEIGLVATELKLTRKHLSTWMKPKRVSTRLLAMPGISRIYPEPLGVVLIIAPWNYPVQLTLIPLIGALAAGNCAVIKPSEVAPATSKLLANELPKYIDTECFAIVEGAAPETTALLTEYFDHIFYTGSSPVGRIVMAAAAKNLTPVTLELGGKSPCIVDPTANIRVAARRIVWGKFSNAGQSCVAPDYILAHIAIEKELLYEMKKSLYEFYGDNPQASRDYGRVVNSHHYQRLMNLLPGSGDIYVGGSGDEKDSYIAPTILHNVTAHAPVMADEIFGPLLPVLTYNHIDDAINFANSRPKPLALYLFTSDRDTRKHVITSTTSGNVSINYPMLQLTIPDLPFGGVGASGMGAYHGKKSFDIFSHFKSTLIKPTWFDPRFLYPPYTPKFTRLVRWLML
ncbi:MAG: aldehyde dehydrogenase [Gammaproteobacteria bacterium RIFCSPHIGHO2_12_FULL_42_13]|nr:MAG: aldehyde dehydrogenase [Gammaproteobacteria bacterium RIFCSPHIGHO2_12_FULL_42_13]